MLRRTLWLTLTCLWLGGFTFYAAVVIPVGHQLYGDKVMVGRLTQQVTWYLNGLGLAVAGATAWLTLERTEERRADGRRRMALLFFSLAHVALFGLHPVLDARLDAGAQPVSPDFYAWHRVYLWVAIAAWVACLVMAWTTLATYLRSGLSRGDRGRA